MTARDDANHGAVLASAPAQANGKLAPPAASREPAPHPSRTFQWEEWFAHATPAQQADVLSLASRQGLLLSSQIPALNNGVKSAIAPHSRRSALAKLLSGQVEELACLPRQPLAMADPCLDPLQQEAVARALFTPDAFLLNGFPGTGKSRILSEVLHQAAALGQRVLFLADVPAGLDAALERLSDVSSAYVLRYLDAGEKAEDLSARIQAWTLPRREAKLREDSMANAAQGHLRAKARCERRRAEEPLWDRLQELIQRHGNLEEGIAGLDKKLAGLEAEVEQDARESAAAPPNEWCASLRARNARFHESEKGILTRRQETASRRPGLVEAQEKATRTVEELQSLSEARRAGRWWTATWWRAKWGGDIQIRMDEAQTQQRAAAEAVAELDRLCLGLEQEKNVLTEQHRTDRQEDLMAEIERRRADVRQRLAALESERTQWSEEWRQACSAFEMPEHRPASPTTAALEEARRLWQTQSRHDDEACDFSAQWADNGREAVERLVERLPELANVLAGSIAALSQNKGFAGAAQHHFDLLILEDADRLTEADLLRLAHHAPRCVLVASNLNPIEMASAAIVAESKTITSPAALRQSAFAKLWQMLHTGVGRLPYAWFHEGDRLVCQLRTVPLPDRAKLESESVADFPEIELRIWAPAKCRPVLTQVLFPATMGIGQAKAFLYRELEEATVHGAGRSGWLREVAGGFVFHLAPHALPNACPVDLEAGLREWVDPTNGRTCRLEFDAVAGWGRDRVDQWLCANLHGGDLGRTAFLQVPYRQEGAWAETLGDILFAGQTLTNHAPASPAPAPPLGAGFEFVAVPPLQQENSRNSQGNNKNGQASRSAALPREGAGLEQDLASTRIADRLPAEFRPLLPRKGFANFLEAQALIRRFEAMAPQLASDRPIAVIALFEAQVELLRVLAARSAVLSRLPLCIGLAGQFWQREFDTVAVSLTRSHSHRAVPLGERDTDLTLALSRARHRLFVFGDPGALVKRSHWQGPLEHLDSASAGQEARRCGAIVRYLQGQGARPAGFRAS